METAYQKWEKRRQERTGGHRPALSHRRKKGSVALGPREKRRMAQLAVCLALFLVVFIGKGVFPGKLAEVRETVLSAIQADTDFKAAFASLGRSISEGEPILDTLGDLWVEVFGGEAVTVPDGEGQVMTHKMFQDIIVEEEEHLDTFRTELQHMLDYGEEYLALQSAAGMLLSLL